MNRRNFLHTGSLSALGLSLPAGMLALELKKTQTVHSWLQQLAVAAGTRRRSSLLIWSKSLREQMLQSNTYLADRGFLREDSALYFYGPDQKYCFYPLVLRHRSTELTDLLVPVFGQRPDGQWQQIIVLTGYQIEALAHAATGLQEQTLALHELLMPTGFAPVNGLEYSTRQGSVSTRTQLHRGVATTVLTVRRGAEILFSETRRSQHCLRSRPTVTIAA